MQNRVFLDSSILITALLSQRGGSFHIITRLKDDCQFQISSYVLEETIRVLDEKFSLRQELKSYLFILLGLAKIQILSNPPKAMIKKTCQNHK